MKTLLTILLLTNIAFADRPWPDSDYQNPIFFGKQVIGKYGTQWLPKRKFVKIKLTAGVTEGFNRGCYVVTKTGFKEQLDYVNTDSKGRRTFITNLSCENYKAAKIVCEEDKQKVVFKSRKNPCKRIK